MPWLAPIGVGSVCLTELWREGLLAEPIAAAI
jgi:hypothetical protein